MKKILLLCAVALLPLVGCEKEPVQTPEDPSTENPGGENPGKEEPTPEVITDWFVTVDGAGEKTGKSWENAMGVAELNAFLAQPVDAEGNQIDADAHAKAALLDGTTVHVAAGEYFLAGETYAPVKVAFANYTKPVALTILGGYPTGLTEKATTGRDAAANVTEFTGDNLTGILELGSWVDLSFDGLTFKNGAFTDNGGSIYANAGETGECSIALTNCKFTGNRNVEGKTGASIYLLNAAADIKGCYFANNFARNGSAINMGSGKGAVVIEDCVFEQNETANTSGAVQNGGKVAEIKNCTFKKNKAGSWGGGAFHTGGEGANTTFTNCVFEENTAPYGGAISVEAATVTFNSCSFTKNTGTEPVTTKDGSTVIPNVGGAIILRNDASVCTLNDCTVTENQAVTGSGGAIVSTKTGAKLTINGGSFTNNSSYYHGGCIMLFGELYVTGTSSAPVLFANNNTLTTDKAAGNGGAIWVGDNTKVDLKYVKFADNESGKEEGTTVNYSNGGAMYVKAAELFNVDNCEFTGGRARNGGGLALNLGSATEYKAAKITNCNFHDIICRSGADHQNSGDAAGNFNGGACQIGCGNIEFENCIFKGNVVQNSSAVLHINDVCVVSCTDCQFLNNTSYANHGCIKMEKAGEKLYLNRCLFEGNSGASRGMINPNANTLAYLNRVTFKENTTTATGGSWGIAIHCANANVCMNNVTSYNNYNINLETGVNTVAYNSDGGYCVVNSTFIDKAAAGMFRTNGTRKLSFCNNIIINALAPEKIFMLKSAGIYKDGGHNLISCKANHDNASIAATNLLGQSAEALAGTYGNGVYTWANSLTGFTPATSADVYAAIAEYTEADTTVGVDNIGADFYNWLKTIGEVTESGNDKIFKDGRGETRTGNYWPGAYQAK